MAEVLNKVKPYILLSIFQLIINISVYLTNCLINIEFNILSLIGLTTGAFVPFVSLAMSGFVNYPLEVIAFIGIFTGIITAIQSYLIIEVIYSHIIFTNT